MADIESKQAVRSDAYADFLARIDGQGVAGTPAGGVMTVQGVTGMTPISVSIAGDDPDDIPVGYARLITPTEFDSEIALANNTEAQGAECDTTAGKKAYIRNWGGTSSAQGKFTLVAGATFGAATALAPPRYCGPGNFNVEGNPETPILVPDGLKVWVKAKNVDHQAADLHTFLDIIQEV